MLLGDECGRVCAVVLYEGVIPLPSCQEVETVVYPFTNPGEAVDRPAQKGYLHGRTGGPCHYLLPSSSIYSRKGNIPGEFHLVLPVGPWGGGIGLEQLSPGSEEVLHFSVAPGLFPGPFNPGGPYFRRPDTPDPFREVCRLVHQQGASCRCGIVFKEPFKPYSRVEHIVVVAGDKVASLGNEKGKLEGADHGLCGLFHEKLRSDEYPGCEVLHYTGCPYGRAENLGIGTFLGVAPLHFHRAGSFPGGDDDGPEEESTFNNPLHGFRQNPLLCVL